MGYVSFSLAIPANGGWCIYYCMCGISHAQSDVWQVFLSVPELTFAWIFNEFPHFVQQDSRRFISQETGSLYVAKVEPSDVGNYTCVVNNTVTREKVSSSPTPLVLRSDGKCLKLQFSSLYPTGLSHLPVKFSCGYMCHIDCINNGSVLILDWWHLMTLLTDSSALKQLELIIKTFLYGKMSQIIAN